MAYLSTAKKLDVDIDAIRLANSLANGDAVPSLVNSVAGQNSAPQSSAGLRGTIVTGEAPAGQAAVALDGVNDAYDFTNLCDGWIEGTFYFLLKNTFTGAGNSAALTSTTASSLFPFASDGNIYESLGTTVRRDAIYSGASFKTAYRLYTIVSKANDYRVYLDQSLIYSSNSNTVSFPANFILSGSNGGGTLKANFLKILAYSLAHTNAEVAQNTAQFANQYQLTNLGYTPDTTPPSTVTGLTATKISNAQINIDSDAATDNVGVNHYLTEFRVNGGGWLSSGTIAKVFSLTPSVTGFPTVPGTYLLEFRRLAYDAAGNASSAYSNVPSVTITVPVAPPAAAFSVASPVYVGQPLTLVNQTTGSAKWFEWDFENDGNADSAEFEPKNFAYESAGTKTIKLLAGNAGGNHSITHTVVVQASFLAQHFEEFQLAKIFNISNLNLKMPLLEANFGAGYGAGVLTAPPSGLRYWTIASEMIPDLDQYQISYQADGENLVDSRFQYVWNFYRRHLALGNKPFYFTDPRTKRRFLASFVEREISFESLTAKLYRGGIDIRQRRVKLTGLTFRDDDGSCEQY